MRVLLASWCPSHLISLDQAGRLENAANIRIGWPAKKSDFRWKVGTFGEKQRLPAKSDDFRWKTTTFGGKQRLQARKSEKRQKRPRNSKKEQETAKTRERTIRARTSTFQYEYSSIRNGRYRYEYSLHRGVPATYIIIPGRSLRECSLYAMGGTLHPRLNNADH